MFQHSREFEKDHRTYISVAGKVVGRMIQHCQSLDQSQIMQKVNK